MIVLLFNNKNFTETIIHIYTCCSISHIIHILRLVCVVSEEAKQYMVKSFLFKQQNLYTMYAFCVYPAMSKKSENLSDLDKKDRNKRHSSPFINVVKGVFFVVCVTLVPVSYLSAPSAVHIYRVPGKFIRRLKSLFVQYEKLIRLVRIKQKFIRIAYLYSKCTDCRINYNLPCETRPIIKPAIPQ